eukprot:149825-Chlamydomonas_euryale.AAC.1
MPPYTPPNTHSNTALGALLASLVAAVPASPASWHNVGACRMRSERQCPRRGSANRCRRCAACGCNKHAGRRQEVGHDRNARGAADGFVKVSRGGADVACARAHGRRHGTRASGIVWARVATRVAVHARACVKFTRGGTPHAVVGTSADTRLESFL